ncbi:hypothetical protein BpHYR1_005236 [Brachionus plicatilis]|uniref:RNA-directed DNA polymerase from mobile element jockey-like n=1 Tax=Brachionus plicatilis TaxID=10195 RepID=A0A3M7SAS3_BRAPC|nr:hypothetical protein BpHYR1_005236 [Brachionus plicatilis]
MLNVKKIVIREKKKYHRQNTLYITEPREGYKGQLRRLIVRCCNPRYNFFSNRAINIWNCLPNNVINSPTVNSLKNYMQID